MSISGENVENNQIQKLNEGLKHHANVFFWHTCTLTSNIKVASDSLLRILSLRSYALVERIHRHPQIITRMDYVEQRPAQKVLHVSKKEVKFIMKVHVLALGLISIFRG